MNGKMNEKIIDKEYDFNKPLIQKIDSVIDNSKNARFNNLFNLFDHRCEYDINFTKITNNETNNFTSSDKNMSLYQTKKINNCSKKWFYILSHKQSKNKRI